MALVDLYTSRGETLSGIPWNTYPRPQLRRDSFLNLNGIWDFTVTEDQDVPGCFDRQILVPFCPESLLSGIHEAVPNGDFLWYRRCFSLPAGFQKERVLLHFGAVDQICDIYVNQLCLYRHLGGYEAFTVDITAHIKAENELIIRAVDFLTSPVMPYGKQTLNRGGMWYTPFSGIWQTVWLESVPETYIRRLDIQTTGTAAHITTVPPLEGTVTLAGKSHPLCNGQAVLTPDTLRLWSPEDPYLYEFTIQAGSDRVESYFALRTLETKTVDGIPRLCLNGKPYFFHGLLDQGYWPDGLCTPPAPESYADDILAMKALGFNTLRKHIKVEAEQFYYDCDRLGMVVFQDMVNNGDYNFLRDTALPTVGIQHLPDKQLHRDSKTRQAFLTGMEATVRQLKNHPCIVYWTIFNEGWGQFDSDACYLRLKELDSSRFIDSTSGWFRRKKSDVESLHIYFGPWSKLHKYEKPLVLSEFGGYAYPEEGHIFNPEKAYGYKSCKSREAFQKDLETLYRQRILPGIKKGLCAAIYTQVSDVEDEINGLMTYDRKLCKADPQAMQAIANVVQILSESE